MVKIEEEPSRSWSYMGPVKGKTGKFSRQRQMHIENLEGRLMQAEKELQYLLKILKDPKLPSSLKKLFQYQCYQHQVKVDLLKEKLEKAKEVAKEDE
ncbi:MAG: hypothetical protein ACP5JY_03205 [Candidatus Nanoarchaeia archaeon]